MKVIIIIIVILLSFILYLNKKKSISEKFVNYTTSPKDIKTQISNCSNEGNVIYNDLNVTNILKVGNKDIDKYIKEYLFPIGSFYVQFPDKNSNIIFEAFPDSQTPEILFGGTWQEQWPFESIFFRTRGTLSNENRINGFQNYALKHLYGHMGWTQTNLWKPGQGAEGVFGTNIEFAKIDTDSNSGEVVGHRNSMDFDSFASKFESRPDNKLMRVWKKIADMPRGKTKYEEDQRKRTLRYAPMENGFDSRYDNNYYLGPSPYKMLANPTVFNGVTNINDAKKKCNNITGCFYIGRSPAPGNSQVFAWSSMMPVDKINGKNNPDDDKEFIVWERKKVYDLEIQDEPFDDEFNDLFKFTVFEPKVNDLDEFAEGKIDYQGNVEPYYDTDEFGNVIDKPVSTTRAFY